MYFIIYLILSSPSDPNCVRRTSTLLLSGDSCNSSDLYLPSSGRHCEAHCAKNDLLLSCAVDIIWSKTITPFGKNLSSLQQIWTFAKKKTCLNWQRIDSDLWIYVNTNYLLTGQHRKYITEKISVFNNVSDFQRGYLPVRLELYQCWWESVKQHTSYTKSTWTVTTYKSQLCNNLLIFNVTQIENLTET